MMVHGKRPDSWSEIAACACDECRIMYDLHSRAEQRGDHLVVWDGRAFGGGFAILDHRKLFHTPAVIEVGHATVASAIEAVRRQGQARGYAMVSSFPKQKPFTWRGIVVVPIEEADDA